MVKSITGGLDEAIEVVHFLETENAKLRKVVDIVRMDNSRMWRTKQAIAELDKEGER